MADIFKDIDIHKLGDRLQQARKKSGLTQADAAQFIDAARTTMVAIEKGERQIQPRELIKLARAYGCAVSDFIAPSPTAQPFNIQFRTAYKNNSGEDEEIMQAINLLEDLCGNYQQLEKMVDAPLPKNYPAVYEVDNMPIEAAAESIAVAERQRMGLGDAPIPLLRDILEQSVGLRIFYLKMPAKYSGMYTYDQKLGACIAINSDHPEERRRISLAHEYLHFLAHRYRAVVDHDFQYKRKPASERLADAFSSYFMMPTSGLLKRFNDMYREHKKFTPTNLFTLAHYYGVSIEALVLRLEDMQLLPSGTWDRLRDRGLKVRQVQKELELESPPQRTDITPIHYQHLAIEAFEQGLITEGNFASLLKVDRLEARESASLLRQSSAEFADRQIDMNLCEA